MNQRKIGNFIAELRKEQNMTQRQLAECIGVSDKIISKWECGNGLPELSIIPELCRTLGINTNELLSGERLVAENYSTKAEENMLFLMEETTKLKNKSALTTILLSILALTVAIFLGNMYLFTDGIFLLSLFDIPTIAMTVFPTVLILFSSGNGMAFCHAFSMLRGQKSYTLSEKHQSIRAIKLVAKSMLVLGILTSVISLIYILLSFSNTEMDLPVFLTHIAIASLGIMYGLAAYVLLLPIHERLKNITTLDE